MIVVAATPPYPAPICGFPGLTMVRPAIQSGTAGSRELAPSIREIKHFVSI